MSTTATLSASPRELELAEMLRTFNSVTERMKRSHERLGLEVRRLRVELAEKNRELARRERLAALGRMAAGVAHEIRNPLAGIRLYASMLQQDLADRPAEFDTVGKIERAIAGLDRLVGDILLFAGHASACLSDVHVAELFDDVVELAAPRRLEFGARMVVDAPSRELTLRCDRNQVTRALLNLVLNALDAGGDGGSVCVGVVHGDRRLSITVDDSGPGVPAELVDQIFNPFFTTKDSGTGLGLAIVHRVAEAHGGAVRVGAAPNGGARFVLEFPDPGPRLLTGDLMCQGTGA
ncbi:MAG: sensor histidine kinase [Phycisphaerales bacterium]|nr:MAG: sensor histidine kinase [Phycisphaerales bacterium]